jgi:transcriptional regulator with XRE-family HTH domain
MMLGMAGIVVERLEALMQERGYGPGELAYQSGVSYNYIWKIRKGNAPNIAVTQVQKLAKALRTTPDYLTGLSDIVSAEMNGDTYEMIRWRAEQLQLPDVMRLAPDVAGLAQRLDGLPGGKRSRVIQIIDAILGLTEGSNGVEPVEELDDESRRLIRLLDNLSPERLRYWQDRIEGEARSEYRAAEPATGTHGA